jgi:hypothetical protein
VSSREEPKPYVHADVAVGEVLVPCSCDVVAVGGALKPCRSTAVGAENHRRHGARGVPSLHVLPGRAKWDADLVPRSLS